MAQSQPRTAGFVSTVFPYFLPWGLIPSSRLSAFNRSMMSGFKIEGESVSFWLRLKPRAARERLTVDASGELRLELHAPPTDGQANDACLRFFARALRLPQACIVILSGHTARRKLMRVTGNSAQRTIELLETLAAAHPRS